MSSAPDQTIHRDPALLYVHREFLVTDANRLRFISYWILFPITIVMVCRVNNLTGRYTEKIIIDIDGRSPSLRNRPPCRLAEKIFIGRTTRTTILAPWY
jgi:hypothetical protein